MLQTKMKKIFATDLDGTLLRPGNIISPANRHAIERLKENGYTIIFASGRVLSSLKYLMRSIDLSGYYIANNGGVLADDDRVIAKHPISYEALKKISNLADEHGITYHFYDTDTFYANQLMEGRMKHLQGKYNGPAQANFEIRENVLDHIIENKIEIYKMMLHKDLDYKEGFRESFEKIEGINYAQSAPNSMDIFAEGVNKWSGVTDMISDTTEETFVVTIGDYDNDIEMIANADLGIAMGNALDHVKSFAKYITDDNIDDGFAKAVEYLLEEHKC